jgi:hypothetical protein
MIRVLVGLLFAGAAFAGPATPIPSITGLFKDQSGSSVSSLQVVFEDQAHFGTGKGIPGVTDADGHINVYHLPKGQYQIFIPSTGQTRLVTVASSETVTIAPFVVDHVTNSALGGIVEGHDAVGR